MSGQARIPTLNLIMVVSAKQRGWVVTICDLSECPSLYQVGGDIGSYCQPLVYLTHYYDLHSSIGELYNY